MIENGSADQRSVRHVCTPAGPPDRGLWQRILVHRHFPGLREGDQRFGPRLGLRRSVGSLAAARSWFSSSGPFPWTKPAALNIRFSLNTFLRARSRLCGLRRNIVDVSGVNLASLTDPKKLLTVLTIKKVSNLFHGTNIRIQDSFGDAATVPNVSDLRIWSQRSGVRSKGLTLAKGLAFFNTKGPVTAGG